MVVSRVFCVNVDSFYSVALFCSCNIFMVLWMGPKECVCSVRCSANLEELLAVLNAFLCDWNHAAKLQPVFPTYALLQSGRVSLYTPDRMSEVCCLCINNFCMLMLVRNAIFMSVFLNMLLMNVVSQPT